MYPIGTITIVNGNPVVVRTHVNRDDLHLVKVRDEYLTRTYNVEYETVIVPVRIAEEAARDYKMGIVPPLSDETTTLYMTEAFLTHLVENLEAGVRPPEDPLYIH